LNGPVGLLLAIPFGLAIGLVVGTVGGGGAILALPVLVYVLGEDVGPAATASLIVVTMGASVGAGVHARHGRVCWRIALAFSVPAAAGAYLGTVLGTQIDARTLVLAFVPVMLAAAAFPIARAGDDGADDVDEECATPPLPRAGLSGFAVGAMTGLFGVGGGFLIVPALTVLMGLAVRRAIATSLAIITLTGIAALLSHLAEGAEPDWELTVTLCAAAAAGALAGSSLAGRLEPRVLTHAFAAVVATVALLLLADVLLLGGPPGSG
jgi:uncharacterized protein